MTTEANVPPEIAKNREMRAFGSSCMAIASLLGLFGLGLFPNIVLSTPNPSNSLTIHNSAASHAALSYMFTIVLIGLPFVIGYTVTIYWVFRGKVREESLVY